MKIFNKNTDDIIIEKIILIKNSENTLIQGADSFNN
jgi:hypothetical protein